MMIVLGLILTSNTGPVIANSNSNLQIADSSGTIYDLTYEQLLAMPKTTIDSALYCDGSLATSGNWSGVLLSYLLTQTQLTPVVSSIQFAASDGYTVNIPIDLAMQPQTILAYEKDGQPLAEGLRLILPGANGASWIALITSITMSTSGANYPEAVTVGIGKIADLSASLNRTTAGSPTQQPTTQPKPTPIVNSSSNQPISPENVTTSNQPTPETQLSSNQTLNFYAELLTIIATVIILALSATVYLTYKRKTKPLKMATKLQIFHKKNNKELKSSCAQIVVQFNC